MLQKAPMYAYIPATDVARARKFYEQKLGFEPKEEVAGGVFYECGGRTACFLYPTAHAGTSKASQAFWQVEDVEHEVAELRGRGVRFEEYDEPGLKTENGIATGGGAKAAWFKDSEGNILAIIQSYQPHGAGARAGVVDAEAPASKERPEAPERLSTGRATPRCAPA